MQKLTFADKHGSEVRTNLLSWCCIFCFLPAFATLSAFHVLEQESEKQIDFCLLF